MNLKTIILTLGVATTLTILAGFKYEAGDNVNKVPVGFIHDDCRGNYLYLSSSIPNLHDYGWGDEFSSAIVPDGWKLVFYEHIDYCGATFTLYPGTISRFRLHQWNDVASSVKVYYRGKLQGYAYSCSKPRKPRRQIGDNKW